MAAQRISKLLKDVQLRGVKTMKFSFDPYVENVRSIREVLHQVNSSRVLDTNPNCISKVDVRSDRSQPQMEVKFVDSHKVIFKTQHLTTLEIIEKFHQLCKDKDPKKGAATQQIAKGQGKAKLRKK